MKRIICAAAVVGLVLLPSAMVTARAAEKHRIQILLPIAAVAIGMTIFGLVFALVVPNLNS